MNKLIVLLLMFASSTSAMAKWTFLSASTDSQYKAYVDYTKVPKAGNLVKMWDMFDYKTIQETSDAKYLSSKSRSEYNCEEKTSRVVAIKNYSGNMALGKLVYSSNKNPDTTFGPIASESVSEVLWKVACGKK